MTNADGLRARMKQFAFAVLDLVKQLPRSPATDVIARQLVGAGTSVAANHRAAGRSRSRREFVAKLGIALEEADESEFWLESLLRAEPAREPQVQPLLQEASELRAILAASLATAKRRTRGEGPGA